MYKVVDGVKQYVKQYSLNILVVVHHFKVVIVKPLDNM